MRLKEYPQNEDDALSYGFNSLYWREDLVANFAKFPMHQ